MTAVYSWKVEASLVVNLQILDVAVFFVTVFTVVIFAGYWFPKELEKLGEGYLPRRFGVSVLFSGMNVSIFVLILFILHLGNNAGVVEEILKAANIQEIEKIVNNYNKSENSETVLSLLFTSLAVFFALFGFGRWRMIEAGVLRQLHNVSLVKNDEKKLAENLRTCSLLSADCYSEEGIDALHRLQRRAVLNEAKQRQISLAEMARKTERLLTVWSEGSLWENILPRAERPSISSVRLSHERRMTLALKIDEYVEKLERGEGDLSWLSEVISALKAGNASDEEILLKLKKISPSNEDKAVDERRIKNLLAPLVDFFLAGYSLHIDDLVNATAKAVILSGDDADERLDELKNKGFSGIGNVVPIDLHRAILIASAIFVFTIVAFFMWTNLLGSRIDSQEGEKGRPFIFFIATSITLAVIVGTMVGGLRNFASPRRAPWGWYFLAALTVVLAHITIVSFAVLSGLSLQNAGNPDYQPVKFSIAGSIVPFATVLGICVLSRRPAIKSRLPERMADGLQLAVILFVAGVLFNVFIHLTGLEPPRKNADFSERMLLISAVTLSLGLFIGVIVVNQVRSAALSQIVTQTTIINSNNEDERRPVANNYSVSDRVV